MEKLFYQFGKELVKQGLIENKGKLIDVTILNAPKQRNIREQNNQIKGGEIPEEWSDKKFSHKDVDAT